MNTLVEPKTLDESYDYSLLALFEAICAAGIEKRPSPEDVKPDSSAGKQAPLSLQQI